MKNLARKTRFSSIIVYVIESFRDGGTEDVFDGTDSASDERMCPRRLWPIAYGAFVIWRCLRGIGLNNSVASETANTGGYPNQRPVPGVLSMGGWRCLRDRGHKARLREVGCR